MSSSAWRQLVADSREGLLLEQSTAFPEVRFDTEEEAVEAAEWVAEHPDEGAFLPLLALRRQAPAAYQSIAVSCRAQVLAVTLRNGAALNNFGYLDNDGGFDDEAGQAAIELGAAGAAAFAAELEDLNPAQYDGSEESALVDAYGIRRADLAYRYISLMRAEPAQFDPDPRVRDEAIHSLKDQLRASRQTD